MFVYLLKDIKLEARMYNSYHSLMTTLKSLYLVLSSVLIILLLILILLFVSRLLFWIVIRFRFVTFPVHLWDIQRVASWNNDVEWIHFVCGYLSNAVSLSLSSACTPSFVLMINEANILLWQTVVVTFIWSTTATMRRPYGVRQLTRAIVRTIAVRGTLLWL